MSLLHPLACVLLLGISTAGSAQVAVPLAPDTVVMKAGNFTLTKAEYEQLIPGFDRASGAVATGATPQSMQSGKEVARLLALVSEAQLRKIDQTPDMQALIKVRGYVLLANALLESVTKEVRKDEAGTRALWNSEKNNFIDVQSRQILIRHKGSKSDEPGNAKGSTRDEAQAKILAMAAYKKVQSGADFATVARASSDDQSTSTKGGELPAFTRGAMVSEFEMVAFSLPVGSVSEPFKTKYGYHVIRVDARRPFPFERVKSSLEFIRARQKLDEIAGDGVQLNDAYFQR